ncbi:MAG: GDP-mannose 4,6-dehydratase [Hyphomicrobiales bacterium]|nr:GDP-mannose 4,6-dehydratase [Hyphomicrobiales bacterium]
MAGAAAPFRRILFTGGAGFVGGYLAPMVAEAFPHSERAILTRPGERAERPGWSQHEIDLGDAGAVEAFVADMRPDLVLHFAAQASAAVAATAPEETRRVNRDGALTLARAAAQADPACVFFFVSTGEVYGDHFRDGPARETTPLAPNNVYAQTKADAERGLPEALGAHATLIVARPFNHTGPGQDTRFVMPSFARQAAEIEAGLIAPRMIVGNIEARRDFLDVRDVAAAYVALLRAAPQMTTIGEDGDNVFNIASGAPRRIGDLLDILRAETAAQFAVEVDPARLRPNDIPVIAGDAQRLRASTGWAPQIALEQTLRDLLDDMRARIKAGA